MFKYKFNSDFSRKGVGATAFFVVVVTIFLFMLIMGFFTQISSNTALVKKMEDMDVRYYKFEGYLDSILTLMRKSSSSKLLFDAATESYFFKKFTKKSTEIRDNIDGEDKDLLIKNLKLYGYPVPEEGSFDLRVDTNILQYDYSQVGDKPETQGEAFGFLTMEFTYDGLRIYMTKEFKVTSMFPPTTYHKDAEPGKEKTYRYPLLLMTRCDEYKDYDDENGNHPVFSTKRSITESTDTDLVNNIHYQYYNNKKKQDVLFGISVENFLNVDKRNSQSEYFIDGIYANFLRPYAKEMNCYVKDNPSTPASNNPKWQFFKLINPDPTSSGSYKRLGNYPIQYEKIWYSFKSFEYFLKFLRDNKYVFEETNRKIVLKNFSGIVMIANRHIFDFVISKDIIYDNCNIVLLGLSKIAVRGKIRREKPNSKSTFTIATLYDYRTDAKEAGWVSRTWNAASSAAQGIFDEVKARGYHGMICSGTEKEKGRGKASVGIAIDVKPYVNPPKEIDCSFYAPRSNICVYQLPCRIKGTIVTEKMIGKDFESFPADKSMPSNNLFIQRDYVLEGDIITNICISPILKLFTK